ncbi:MAG: cysteine peptidase family C39 domain-containing protein [Desulfobacterales bacterium]|nr:hypothetical protein [Pseudomonadota bacterium]MCG2771864.1 cysteine peptidase family C39 domain-containing protein [Desulfobacterales bacterium]
MAAGQLGGQLYPTYDLTPPIISQEVNLSFGIAIQAWNRHEYQVAVAKFKRHMAQYPDSPWVSEALLHIGCDAIYHGRYNEAGNCFSQILEVNNSSPHPGAQMLAIKARLRLANLKSLQGNFREALNHLSVVKQSSPDWRDRTYAAHWIQRLSRERHQEQAMLNCGVQALAHLLKKKGKEAAAKKVLSLAPESRQGHSMQNLKTIAADLGYRLNGLRLSVKQLQEIPLPAIVQLSGENQGDRGHYWVLEASAKESFRFFDPQSGNRFTQTPAEFSREWGGNALVFSQRQDLPGLRLAAEDMGKLFGGCCGVKRKESDLGDFGSNNPGCGAPTWAVNKINFNFFAHDVPLWYSSPIGPSVEIALSYNSQSAINQHEPFGNKWQFNYATYLVEDTSGRVTVFMPDGRRDLFTPDGLGGYTPSLQVFNTLVKVSTNHYELRFPEDVVFVYDIPPGTTSLQSFLVEIRDPQGLKLTFGYDADIQLRTITDALNRVATLTYNANHLVTQVRDPFGRTATFNYDASKNLVQITDMGGYSATLTYDQDSYITSLAKGRSTWQFHTEPPDGIPNGSNPYPAPGGVMWENYRITFINPDSYKEEYHYDGLNSEGWYVSPRNYVNYVSLNNSNYKTLKTTYNYTNVSSTTGAIGKVSKINYPLGGGFQFSYDQYGNRTRIYDNQGYTTYTYNSLGRINKIIDALNKTTNITYAGNNVDPVLITDTLGSVTLTYNETHNVTTLTDRLGKITTCAYNSYGQLTSVVDPLGIITTYLYDAGHRLQEIRRANQRLHSFTYDALDRILTYTDPSGLKVTSEYNNLNQITRLTYPDGKFIRWQYSTCCPYLVDSVTERSGLTAFFSYDRFDRLTSFTDLSGKITRHAYDPDGNHAEFIDPKGNITKFKYDSNNRLRKKIYDDNSYDFFTYYASGLPHSREKANGIITYYAYNGIGNPTRTSYVSGGAATVNYLYDVHSRLTQINNTLGSFNFTYDANSRLASMDGPWANDKLTFQYDGLGRRTGMTREKGQPVTYSYDDLNRLTGLTIGTGNSYAYAYLGAGPRVQSLTRPNGSVTTYQYDTLKRLTQLSTAASGATINQYVYSYNQQDQRSSEAVIEPNPLVPYQNEFASYVYDGLNQLLSISNPAKKDFTYDRAGNLVQGYTPDGYAFTAAYDPENRLTAVSYKDGGGVLNKTEYLYIGDILIQVKKSKGGVLQSDTRYAYEGSLAAQERNAANNVLREYTWGLDLGGGIGGLLHLNQAGSDNSYLYDGKGNVTSVLDAGALEAAAYQYDPFGTRRLKSGSLEQPMQFSTKPYDEQTGLSFYGYRFYNPALGRWMTKDPLGEAGGMNLYAFVRNNPIKYIDPLGLNWEQAARSGGNMVEDVFTAITGGFIATATSPTVVGIWVGGALVFKGSYGAAVNAGNFFAALFEKNQVSRGSFLNDVVALPLPNNQSAQCIATAADLTLDIVGGKLSTRWIKSMEVLLGILGATSASDDVIQTYDPQMRNDIRNLIRK